MCCGRVALMSICGSMEGPLPYLYAKEGASIVKPGLVFKEELSGA
jgi:hypothetical protein